METKDWIPAGWPVVTPRLFVEEAEALVTFIQQVFGASGAYHAEHPPNCGSAIRC